MGCTYTFKGQSYNSLEELIICNNLAQKTIDFLKSNGENISDSFDIDKILNTTNANELNEEHHTAEQLRTLLDENPMLVAQLNRDKQKKSTKKNALSSHYRDDAYAEKEKPFITTEEARQNEAINYATKLSKKLGVDVEVITKNDAVLLLQSTPREWQGEAAFFYKEKIYFVDGMFNKKMVFHEFSHPFLRSLRMNSPEEFKALYNILKTLPEGASIIETVRAKRTDLLESSPLFMEECLAIAVTQYHDNYESTSTSKFASLVNNILYYISKLLKKTFGVEVFLGKSITMQEIAKKLEKSGKIKMSSVPEEGTIAMFTTEVENNIKGGMIDSNSLQVMIDKNYASVRGALKEVMKHKDFNPLYEDIFGKENPLADAKVSLEGYQAIDKNKSVSADIERATNMVSSFANYLDTVDNMLAKLATPKSARTITEMNGSARDFLWLTSFVDQILDNNNGVLAQIDRANEDNLEYGDSPLKKKVDSIRSNANTMQGYINTVNKKITRSFIETQLGPIYEIAKEKSDRDFEENQKRLSTYLSKKGYSPERIANELKRQKIQHDGEFYGCREEEKDMWEAAYKAFKNNKVDQFFYSKGEFADNGFITGKWADEHPEWKNFRKEDFVALYQQLGNNISKAFYLSPTKIDALLEGALGDFDLTQGLKHQLESYSHSDNPIVYGFFSYIQDQMQNVQAEEAEKFDDLRQSIEPLLKELGYSRFKPQELGKKLIFKDQVVDGNGTVRTVYKWQSQWKGYEVEQYRWNKKVEKARDDHNADPTNETLKQQYRQIRLEHQRWLNTYFNQTFVPEYYEAIEKIEKMPYGFEALQTKSDIFNRIRDLQQTLMNNTDKVYVETTLNEIDALYVQLDELTSEYNSDGTKKQGKDEAIAKALRAHAEAMSAFREKYDDDETISLFSEAYRQFSEHFLNNNSGLTRTSKEYVAAMNKWVNENTNSAYHGIYFFKSSKAIKNIQKILQKKASSISGSISNPLSALFASRLAFDLEMYNAISDRGDIPIDELFFSDRREKLANLEQESFDALARVDSYKNQERLTELAIKKIKNGGFFDTDAELEQYKQDLEQKYGRGLDYETAASIEETIRTVYDKETEDFNNQYKYDVFNMLQAFENLLASEGTNENLVFKEFGCHAMEIRRTDENIKRIDAFLGKHQSVDFISKWYKETHYLHNDEWHVSEMYRYTRPIDPYLVERTTVVIDGQPVYLTGKISRKFSKGHIKEELFTKRVEWETIDNCGNFLPKSKEQLEKEINEGKHKGIDRKELFQFINEDYYKIKEEGGPLFELIEKMKEYHLEGQRGLPTSRKNGLEYARFLANTNTEKITRAFDESPIKRIGRSIERFFDIKGASKESAAEQGWSPEETVQIARAGVIGGDEGEQSSLPPVIGLGLHDIADVSLDFITSTVKYHNSSAVARNNLQNNNAYKAILSTIRNIKYKSFSMKEGGIMGYTERTSDGKFSMESTLQNIYDKQVLGQTSGKMLGSMPFLRNMTQLLMGVASGSFFDLNPAFAIKNSLTFRMQMDIEAGKNNAFGEKDLLKGQQWSARMQAAYHTKGMYSVGQQRLDYQLLMAFDMVEGTFSDRLGQEFSTSLRGQVLDGKWKQMMRGILEKQPILTTYSAMLYHTQIPILVNGKRETTNYMEAFELDKNGAMKLKDGIDIRYSNHSTVMEIDENTTVDSLVEKYFFVKRGEEGYEKAIDDMTTILKQQTKTSNAEDAIKKILDTINRIEEKKSEALTKPGAIEEDVERRFEAIVKSNLPKIKNTKFAYKRTEAHTLIQKLGGNYAIQTQPELERTFIGKNGLFLTKFFIPMMENRWGGLLSSFSYVKDNGGFGNGGLVKLLEQRPGKVNYAEGVLRNGFYTDSLLSAINMVRTLKGDNVFYWHVMTAEQKRNVIRALTEVIMSLLFTTVILPLLCGWDGDDDDKFKKLRKKSGALPVPFADKARTNNFNFSGWLQLQFIYTVMQTYGEFRQLSLVGGGLSPLQTMTNLTPTYSNPTLGAVALTLKELFGKGNPLYQQSVGPYEWQQKDSYKLVNRYMKLLGLNGKFVDPYQGIKDFQAGMSRGWN